METKKITTIQFKDQFGIIHEINVKGKDVFPYREAREYLYDKNSEAFPHIVDLIII